MKRANWTTLNEPQRAVALARPDASYSKDLLEAVAAILDDVRLRGDAAVGDYTRRFDGVSAAPLALTTGEIERARAAVSDAVKRAVKDAIERIERFHAACIPQPVAVETAPGVICERRPVPIDTVGLYVPAGRAPLPSTALMLGVPSRLAGCRQRVLCVPPRKDGTVDPVVVYAATECGVSRIFRIGGAQAIAAMAWGTESIPRCDKIFGPGNAWVTAAKMLAAQGPNGVSIDMPAGPSEVMVIADDQANPAFVAADVLSQCEHGPDSQAIVVCRSNDFADAVERAIVDQLATLKTRDTARQSLEHSVSIVVDDEPAAIDVANQYAPEHLIIQTASADQLNTQIISAGSVFVGHWTPETLGDYCSGTNHVLPTYGFARSTSGVSVDSFMRQMTVQRASRDGLKTLAATATELARAEGLDAHARAVDIRLGDTESRWATQSMEKETQP